MRQNHPRRSRLLSVKLPRFGRRVVGLLLTPALWLTQAHFARAAEPSVGLDAQDLVDTAYELSLRGDELMRFASEARVRVVPGWEGSATVPELADALDDLSRLQVAHAQAALAAMFEQGDPLLALDEIALANHVSTQAEVAAAAVSVAAGMPPAVAGGAELATLLPVPDGKYEGWIIPQEALAAADVVKVDPASPEGEALAAWRDMLEENAKWLGEKVFVEDLYVKDPLVVSELLAVGPRWLGEGGVVYVGQTLHLQNVWLLKSEDVYGALKQPELMTALTIGGWEAGATAWDCGTDAVFVPTLWEGRKVICQTKRVELPDGLHAPDGRSWIQIATDCSIVPEKVGECKPLPGVDIEPEDGAPSPAAAIPPPPMPPESYPPIAGGGGPILREFASAERTGFVCEVGNPERHAPASSERPGEAPLGGLGVPQAGDMIGFDGPFEGDLLELNPDPNVAELDIAEIEAELDALGLDADDSNNSDARYVAKQVMWAQRGQSAE